MTSTAPMAPAFDELAARMHRTETYDSQSRADVPATTQLLSPATPMVFPDATTERRLRREADRQGLQLRKSRTWEGWTSGTYMLVDMHANAVVGYASPDGYGLSLDDVATFLAASPE